jgi:hypothetical protein
MRLLVFGSRNFDDKETLEFLLNEFSKKENIEVVIEGEAPGADTMARQWAKSRRIPVLPFPADWKKHGKAAGPIRNKQMIDEGNPDCVYGFIKGSLSRSRGSKNMVEQARRANLRVIYTEV